VLDGERLVGLIDAATVERVPPSQRAGTAVEDVVLYEPGLVVDEAQDVANLLERPVFQRVGRAVVVARDGRVGILSVTDVNRVLRALELGGLATTRPHSA